MKTIESLNIESLNQESLKMIEQMAAKILDFAATANKELDILETDQQNKKYKIANDLELIKRHSEQIIQITAAKYLFNSKLKELKQ
tara:strand:- start:24 stop:281 length:258 start_codon:yes stop_codon:yes gene_type:complete